MTGVSESGYPKGQPADSGSPAIGASQRPEKEKKPAEAKWKRPVRIPDVRESAHPDLSAM